MFKTSTLTAYWELEHGPANNHALLYSALATWCLLVEKRLCSLYHWGIFISVEVKMVELIFVTPPLIRGFGPLCCTHIVLGKAGGKKKWVQGAALFMRSCDPTEVSEIASWAFSWRSRKHWPHPNKENFKSLSVDIL